MNIATLFDAEEVAAVRVCFGPQLPDPVVERVLELQIERSVWYHEDDDDKSYRTHIEYFKNHRPHGKWESWQTRYSSGKWYIHKLSERNFRDGNTHGKCEYWHENGQKWYEINHRNGKWHGKFEEWYKDGTVAMRGYYDDDAQTGRWEKFGKDGLSYVEQPFTHRRSCPVVDSTSAAP